MASGDSLVAHRGDVGPGIDVVPQFQDGKAKATGARRSPAFRDNEEVVTRPPSGAIPEAPGSYQFLDVEGRPIYIGKAASLRQRLNSYFQDPSGLAFRTRQMVEAADRVEWTVTASEVEALILEHSLIQRHKPRFNVRLKDDKSYPWLAVSVDDEWARPMVLRGKRRRGLRYFGPFGHVRSLRTTLDQLLRAYPLRSCTNAKLRSHQRLGRPCLLADIGKCAAPCVGAVTPEAYAELLGGFIDAVQGNLVPLRAKLSEEMAESAAAMEYEQAARLRNRIAAVDQVAEVQELVLPDDRSIDLVGFASDAAGAALSALRVRHGRIVGRTASLLDGEGEDGDLAMSGLLDYYGAEGLDWPEELVLPEHLVDPSTLRRWFAASSERPPKVTTSVRGTRRSLLDRAQANAAEDLRRDRLHRASDHNARSQALLALQEALGMPEAPLRIECFDMSHFQGTNYVGSMVVFEDGLARRDAYRRFEVKTVEGNDDFAAMREVLRRRLGYLVEPSAGEVGRPRRFGYRPQLLVIDGGKGQLAEAHRFAVGFHRQRRGKAMVASLLDEVPGLGPARQAKLLETFGTVRGIREAGLDGLRGLPWLPDAVARAVWDALQGYGDAVASGSPETGD